MAAGQRVYVPGVLFVVLVLQCTLASATWQYADPARYPNVPSYGPQVGRSIAGSRMSPLADQLYSLPPGTW